MTPHQPQVGDVITTADIRTLPGRTILLFHGQVAAAPFVWLSDAEILIPPLGVDEPVRIDDFTRGESFTIAYLPGQPPRPERVVKAEALPLDTLDAIVEHLMADGTRDGLIHANTLNWTFGRSARRLAARIEAGETR